MHVFISRLHAIKKGHHTYHRRRRRRHLRPTCASVLQQGVQPSLSEHAPKRWQHYSKDSLYEVHMIRNKMIIYWGSYQYKLNIINLLRIQVSYELRRARQFNKYNAFVHQNQLKNFLKWTGHSCILPVLYMASWYR